jgi:hypothetical protein
MPYGQAGDNASQSCSSESRLSWQKLLAHICSVAHCLVLQVTVEYLRDGGRLNPPGMQGGRIADLSWCSCSCKRTACRNTVQGRDVHAGVVVPL